MYTLLDSANAGNMANGALLLVLCWLALPLLVAVYALLQYYVVGNDYGYDSSVLDVDMRTDAWLHRAPMVPTTGTTTTAWSGTLTVGPTCKCAALRILPESTVCIDGDYAAVVKCKRVKCNRVKGAPRAALAALHVAEQQLEMTALREALGRRCAISEVQREVGAARMHVALRNPVSGEEIAQVIARARRARDSQGKYTFGWTTDIRVLRMQRES